MQRNKEVNIVLTWKLIETILRKYFDMLGSLPHVNYIASPLRPPRSTDFSSWDTCVSMTVDSSFTAVKMYSS